MEYIQYSVNAGGAPLVEHNPSKVRVAGSSLVSRSKETVAALEWYIYFTK